MGRSSFPIVSVSGIVSTAAIVAVIYFLIDCLKKTGTAIPHYAKLANRDTEKSSDVHSSSTDVAVAVASFAGASQHQVEDLPDKFGTMDRHLTRFSSQQLIAFTNDYAEVLGSGGFGVVFKGELENGTAVAVKVLSNAHDKRIEEQFMAEVSAIGRTHHRNLVRLYGFCFESTTRALVYEFMENGSLDMFLFGKKMALDPQILYEFSVGIAKGLAYLHEECDQRIVHYDIKPGNILLDRNLKPKIADFGLAKLCNIESSRITMTGFRGTLGYAAPETWYQNHVTYKCDVYSFGMLLFEIATRRRNFDESQTESRHWLPRWTWDMYENGELAILMALLGVTESQRMKVETMLMVALLCIQRSPEKRPTMSTVVKLLEGDATIPQPEFPFENDNTNKPEFSSTDGSDWDTSSFKTKYSKGQSSKPVNGEQEIELASY